ncbi:B-type regulatory subunit of protein phosphatase 2A [Metarhizium robertsii]|uniref:B-type regulatory subunit of protein phosphatase 2A n=1 Tax=Metarhizium robertsii TaxID=568076 RepID=A0A014QR60_9HYPO|nr:B-type regulatory subunit of protein phosphatase 2A [Metarhizium robertsii]
MLSALVARAIVPFPTTTKANVCPSASDADELNLQPFQYAKQLELARLPCFSDVSVTRQQELFLGKVEQCNVIFDFESASDLSSKYIKTLALQELHDYVKNNGFLIEEPMWQVVTEMFAKNVFRPVLQYENSQLEVFDFEDEEDDLVLEVAWAHVEPVYELFDVVMQNKFFLTTSMAESYIDGKFVLCLLARLRCQDPRERGLLKTTLHSIYREFRNHRTFIRQSINGVLLQFAYEPDTPFGIAELLEVLGSIFSGLCSPLKDEYKDTMMRVLIPLHKSPALGRYHIWLAYCITQLLGKDHSLIQAVVLKILRYWPKVNSTKEKIFLDEMEEILELVDDEGFSQIQDKVFHQLAKSIASSHSLVATRALHFWSDERFCSRVRANITTILPIMFPSVYESFNCHWNKPLRSKINDLMEFFIRTSPQLFDDCWYSYAEKCGKVIAQEAKREKRWEILRQMAEGSKT